MEHPSIKFSANFGSRLRSRACYILTALEDGKTTELFDNIFGLLTKMAYNPHSGYVYAVDEDYNCAMMNGDQLDIWFTSPHTGHEGFYDELANMDKSNWNGEDKEWFDSIKRV